MPFEGSIMAAFGATLLWGFGDFFIQRETRKVGDMESLAFISIMGAFGLFPFVLAELPSLFTMQNVFLLSFIGIITFITSVVDFEALKKGKLSVIEVIFEIELPVSVVLGFLFFKETLTFVQFFTIFLIFAGIVMVSVRSFSRGHWNNIKKFEKGVILAFLAAVLMGFDNFFVAVGSKNVSPLMVIWMPWLVMAIVSLFFIWRKNGFASLMHDTATFKRLILITGIVDTLGWLFYATALAKNELSIVTAITETYPAIAIFLGVWLNKEKIMPHQYGGAALALAASVALALIV